MAKTIAMRTWRWVLFTLLFFPLLVTPSSTNYRTNILLIMFDDLRPLIRSYGESHMITPNIDRLAAKSVIFQNANCQVAVCNPSRNSMLTGLRPDITASYSFSNSWRPHLSFPQQFARHGYTIANYGKIYHWDDFDDPLSLGYGLSQSRWYDYQGEEYNHLNSTVNPDRHTPEEQFRDYIYTTKLIEGLGKVVNKEEYFFLGIGYKLPHIHLHYPWKYYDLYRDTKAPRVWSKATSAHLRFPKSSPVVSYRCCAYDEYRYMNDEGNAHWNETLKTPSNLTRAFPRRMHQELMWSYSASITFLDTQIGRLLDAIDEMSLWNNVTIILTSDHGMHNGEKGIW
jgi:iduronate 2-sulfatase